MAQSGRILDGGLELVGLAEAQQADVIREHCDPFVAVLDHDGIDEQIIMHVGGAFGARRVADHPDAQRRRDALPSVPDRYGLHSMSL